MPSELCNRSPKPLVLLLNLDTLRANILNLSDLEIINSENLIFQFLAFFFRAVFVILNKIQICLELYFNKSFSKVSFVK